jgi:hypothetical protein
MLFTKIKYREGGKVELSWITTSRRAGSPSGEPDVEEHRLVSEDLPTPEFIEAMHGLVQPVIDLLWLPGTWEIDLEVVGVTTKQGEDGRTGVVVTCLKPLANCDAPLVFSTPYVVEPPAIMRALSDLVLAATKYLAGERAQGELFAKAEAEESEEEAAAHA